MPIYTDPDYPDRLAESGYEDIDAAVDAEKQRRQDEIAAIISDRNPMMGMLYGVFADMGPMGEWIMNFLAGIFGGPEQGVEQEQAHVYDQQGDYR